MPEISFSINSVQNNKEKIEILTRKLEKEEIAKEKYYKELNKLLKPPKNETTNTHNLINESFERTHRIATYTKNTITVLFIIIYLAALANGEIIPGMVGLILTATAYTTTLEFTKNKLKQTSRLLIQILLWIAVIFIPPIIAVFLL